MLTIREFGKQAWDRKALLLGLPFLVACLSILAVWLIGYPTLSTTPSVKWTCWILTLVIPLLIAVADYYVASLVHIILAHQHLHNDCVGIKNDLLTIDTAAIRQLLSACEQTSLTFTTMREEVEGLPQALRLNSLLFAVAETIRGERLLSSLARSSLVRGLTKSKIGHLERDIREFEELRVEFRASDEFLASLESVWRNALRENAFDSLQFLSLEWVPPDGNFPSGQYRNVYYGYLLSSLVDRNRLASRVFAHTERFDSADVCALEGQFLEDQRVEQKAEEIEYLHSYAPNRELDPFFHRGKQCNLLLAYTEVQGERQPAFLIKSSVERPAEGFSAVVSVNGNDLEEVAKLFGEPRETSTYAISSVSSADIEKKVRETPQGRVFQRIQEGLEGASRSVVAVDLSGCVQGNGIDRWAASCWYHKIEIATDNAAQRIRPPQGASISDSHGFTRIYIVDLQIKEKHDSLRAHLIKAAAKQHIRTFVIEMNELQNARAAFPNERLADFHVVDGQHVARLDIGPDTAYSQSELFNLPQHERVLYMKDDKKQENYENRFLPEQDVSIYLRCVESLREEPHMTLLESEYDVDSWLGDHNVR